VAVNVAALQTAEVPLGFDPLRLITVGDDFYHPFTVKEEISCLAADFTGWTPAFEILDAVGIVLQTGTVTPAAGDATGIFVAQLTAAQTTALGEGTFAYRLRITNAPAVNTLLCGPFRLTECKAAA